MHRISSGLRHIIWVRANFNLLRPRHVFFTHVSIRKEIYHRQGNHLKEYTFIALFHYCVVDMKAPDGDVHSLYHTQIWVICLRGGGVYNIEPIMPCTTSDGWVIWSGGHREVVVVENQDQEENGAVLIWVRCAAIVLSSKAFCDYCTHTWLLYWPMILVQQY